MSFTETQIVNEIRSTAARVFDALGIPADKRSEIDQTKTKRGSHEVFIGGTKTMIQGPYGAWCEYRVEIDRDSWVNVLITVRGLGGNRMNWEIDTRMLDEDADFAEFCAELKRRLAKRAKPITNE